MAKRQPAVDPAKPTQAHLGSAAKIALMSLRAEKGLPLLVPGDAGMSDARRSARFRGAAQQAFEEPEECDLLS